MNGFIMKIMGIDPSMTSSGKVIMDLDDTTLDIKDVQYYGYYSVEKRCINTDKVHVRHVGSKFNKMNIIERRLRAVDILMEDTEDVKYMSIEDYAYGELANRKKQLSTNRILQLAEFSGTVKTEAYRRGIGVIAYPINQNKMFASGDGSAGKPAMCCALRDLYPQWFPKEFTGIYDSPVNDMADAFWLCEVLRCHIKYDMGLELDEITKSLLEAKTSSHGCLLEAELMKPTL